jgi:phospholipid-binding lipoprotein MlaA
MSLGVLSTTAPDKPQGPPPQPATAEAEAPSVDASDPFEPVNRKVYRVSKTLDRYLLRPIAVAYRRILPKGVRKGVHNAMVNWDEPEVFVNDVIQARFSDAGQAALRFGVNSTVGLVGVIDVAAHHGVQHHENGFAVTLGRYGVKPGPYLFVPFLGPSSVRDLAGAGVDLLTNPLTLIRGEHTHAIETAQSATSVIDARAEVEDDLTAIALTATDPYATLRSVHQQRMQALISGDDFALTESPDMPGAPEPPKPHKGEAPPDPVAPPAAEAPPATDAAPTPRP